MDRGEKKPKISIIIPVYNSEKHLKRALQSILDQTMKDFEVIMVNDGSNDRSLEIMEEYNKKYTMSEIINIPNSGPSHARNIGIYRARGEYLSFIDSDDFVLPNFLKTLYDSASLYNSDISCCNYYSYWENIGLPIPHVFILSKGVYSSEKALKYLISDVRMHYYLWNKLWKKSLFVDNGVMLPNMCFEDISVSTRLFYIANKISVDTKPLYYYTKHNDSITKFMSPEKFRDYIKAYEFIRKFLERNGDYNKYKISYKFLGCRIMIETIGILYTIHRKNRDFSEYCREFKETIKKILYLMSEKFSDVKEMEGIIKGEEESEEYLA